MIIPKNAFISSVLTGDHLPSLEDGPSFPAVFNDNKVINDNNDYTSNMICVYSFFTCWSPLLKG